VHATLGVHFVTIILMAAKRFWLVFLVLSGTFASAQIGPVAAVTGGKIRGYRTADGGAAFKRIPFAQPPVGDLRWREPQPVKPWPDIREATKFSVACTQLSEGWNDRFVPASAEDCLYLNVAAPQWPPQAKFPVMVWIHGGSNTAGDADDAGFDERTLVHRGVVLVTISYRLGALGFLVSPELSRESRHHVSGNYGLMDQLAALRWVHDNIARFGGDPGNVTAFGESAGSFDISILMTSPLAKGLFQRAITESGAVAGFHGARTKSYSEEISGKLAARLKAPNQGTIKFLRTIPAETILRETQLASGNDRVGLEVSLDGWVLPDSPVELFAAGHSMSIPLLIGSNAQEIPGAVDPNEVRELIQRTNPDRSSRALELYGLSGVGVGKTDPIYGGPGIQLATDTGFRCPAIQDAIAHSNAGHATFLYEFQHPQPGHQYTNHNSELNFLFGTWPQDAQLTAIDHKISEQMQLYWTNFARTGNPNGSGLPPWPLFASDTQPYLAFTDQGVVAKSGLRRDFCDVWRKMQKTTGK